MLGGRMRKIIKCDENHRKRPISKDFYCFYSRGGENWLNDLFFGLTVSLSSHVYLLVYRRTRNHIPDWGLETSLNLNHIRLVWNHHLKMGLHRFFSPELILTSPQQPAVWLVEPWGVSGSSWLLLPAVKPSWWRCLLAADCFFCWVMLVSDLTCRSVGLKAAETVWRHILFCSDCEQQHAANPPRRCEVSLLRVHAHPPR